MQTIKEALASKLIGWINNPHTSGSAFLFGGLKVAGIIWPQKKAVLDEVANAAIVYGFITAGDANPRNQNESK